MAFAETLSDKAVGSLVGAVAGSPTGLIPDGNTYRRYRAGLTTGLYEHGSTRTFRRSIFYEVGRRHQRLTDALRYTHAEDDAMEIDCSFAINPAQAANFEGWARKYSNFAPQWSMMDLCGMVERLAKGVAAQSVYGATNTNHLRGGQELRVVALGTLDAPQTASNCSVFIPRTVDVVGNDHVFAVLVASANGEGATVTTDVLRLNPATNEPIVPAVTGPVFAQACVEALRVLGANFEESGAGDLFAYALTRGIHSVVSVVSHTDEGGWIRNVFRSCNFRVPYGGINQSLRAYPALPPLAGTSLGAAAAWVDAVALKTAALVAHCDPCVSAEGGLYPTVFTSNSGAIGHAGNTEEEGTHGDANAIGRQITADGSRFAPVFIQGLLQLFGLRSNSAIAESHFCSTLSSAMFNVTDRHLMHKTVAPYFWIEPTSLIPHDFLGSPAERGGFGAFVTPGTSRATPYFERIKEIDRGMNANFSTIAFKMRTARTSGLVAAYAATPAELAGVKLYQFDESSIVLPGDHGPTNGDVPTKHQAADPISSYLWTRGQSPLPAPAEFINTQSMYAAKYKVVDWDDDFNASMGDIPEAWEMEDHDIQWRVTVPTALANGASNAADSDAKRARARAAVALSQASIRARGYGDANSPVITVSNVPPQFDEAPIKHTPDHEGLGVHSPDPGRTWQPASGNDPAPVQEHVGAPVMPVPHHQPLRGAPYPRAGGGVLGGFVAPAPPPAPGPPAGGANPPSAPPSDGAPPSDQGPAGANPAPPV